MLIEINYRWRQDYDSIYMKFWERQNFVKRKWLLKLDMEKRLTTKYHDRILGGDTIFLLTIVVISWLQVFVRIHKTV